MDEETARYAALVKAKQSRLHVLDKQAATYGLDTPPHIEMERVSLREELGMVESAIQTPARAKITDELGPAGRFLVNYEQTREIKQSIAELAAEFKMHRIWLLIIGVVVVLILVAVAVIIGYLVARGGT